MNFLPGKRTVMVFLAVAAVLLLPLAAQADMVDLLTETLYLNVGNTSTPGLSDAPIPTPPGAFATVNVTLDPNVNTATFLFKAQGAYLFTDGGAIALNLGGTFTVISVIASGGAVPTLSPETPPSEQIDGFGKFNFVYGSGSSGTDGRFSSAKITLNDVTADTLDELLISTLKGNDQPTGYIAAAHLGLLSNSTDYTSDFLRTGFAGTGPPPDIPVPVPASVLLLGSGLLGLGLIGWRRREKKV